MKVSEDVLKVLDRAEFDGAGLKIAEQLPRPMYVAVNKVLEAAGGKWNRKAKAHLFDGDARDAIEPVILTGEVTDVRREFDQFYTPVDLAQRLCDIAGVKRGDLFLEPSAGRGAIANEAKARGAMVCVIELEKSNVATLQQFGYDVVVADFAQHCIIPGSRRFDAIVMNPPFSKRQDIKHVWHALTEFLATDGRLVAVMSAGVLFREDKLTRDFRVEIERRGGRFEPLPDGAFKESGTMVRTCLCIVGC